MEFFDVMDGGTAAGGEALIINVQVFLKLHFSNKVCYTQCQKFLIDTDC